MNTKENLRNLRIKGMAITGAVLSLASSGCGNNEAVNFPTCKEDPQPKSRGIILHTNSVILNSYTESITIGNIRLTPGIKRGEFDSRLIKENTLSTKISPIENGIVFEDPETERIFKVIGKEAYLGKVDVLIETTCPPPSQS